METHKQKIERLESAVRKQEIQISDLRAVKERLRAELASCARILELNSNGVKMVSVVSAQDLLEVTR